VIAVIVGSAVGGVGVLVALAVWSAIEHTRHP
jgi:hypothetical protein